MRRRFDELLPLEEHVLLIGKRALTERKAPASAQGWFHAYGASQAMAQTYGDSLAKNGTLYRSLRGLATRGYLIDRLETEEEAATHTGPARRYFQITAEGERALADADARRKQASKGLLASKKGRALAPTMN